MGRKKLTDAYEEHSEWKASLESWHKAAKEAAWRHFADVRQTWRSADRVGECVIFDISHNRCRLIANINYPNQRLIILHVLSHTEYDKGRWKNDCCA